MFKEAAKEWIKSALDDLITIKEIIDNPFITNIVAFHAQQCIEKSLKAIIEYEGKEVPKVHNLQYLFSLVKFPIEINMEIVKKLDELYIESRYPIGMGFLPYGKPSLSEAKKFYEFAKYVFNKTCEFLEIEKKELKII
jgi:HEPN domain-containing protein